MCKFSSSGSAELDPGFHLWGLQQIPASSGQWLWPVFFKCSEQCLEHHRHSISIFFFNKWLFCENIYLTLLPQLRSLISIMRNKSPITASLCVGHWPQGCTWWKSIALAYRRPQRNGLNDTSLRGKAGSPQTSLGHRLLWIREWLPNKELLLFS